MGDYFTLLSARKGAASCINRLSSSWVHSMTTRRGLWKSRLNIPIKDLALTFCRGVVT